MTAWPSTRSRRVLAALLRIGWVVKRQSGSHRTLSRIGWAGVVKAKVSGPHSVDLTFKDGTRKRVNLLPLLEGPVFQPLRNPSFFARVRLDPVAGTLVWPNGADIAPEALYKLPEETNHPPERRPYKP